MLSQEHDKVILAVYGSLRPGMYNADKIKYTHMGTHNIAGYEMYDLGSYPGIVKTTSFLDKVEVDLIEVDAQTGAAIDIMEINAGYFIVPIYIMGTLCKLYVYDRKYIKDDMIPIKNGNWVDYVINRLSKEQFKKQTSDAIK